LGVDPSQLRHADCPPVADALATSGISLPLQLRHHPRPKSGSRSLKMASAVS
jgi:hypothetical protein